MILKSNVYRYFEIIKIIIIIIMSFISTGWIAHLVIQTSLQCGPALYTIFTQ